MYVYTHICTCTIGTMYMITTIMSYKVGMCVGLVMRERGMEVLLEL